MDPLAHNDFAILQRCVRASSIHAYHMAARSLRAAEMQNHRIWLRADQRDPGVERFEDILIDVHFYFVALRNVYRFLDTLFKDDALAKYRPDLESLNKKWFGPAKTARDAIEHLDERFPGEKRESYIAEVEENGARRRIHFGLRLSKGEFYHSDMTWDISRAGFREIAQATQLLLSSAFANSEADPPAA